MFDIPLEYLTIGLWVVGGVTISAVLFLLTIMLVISIIECNHKFEFHLGFQVQHHRREAWPLGGDAGSTDQQSKITKPINTTANDRQLAMQGGILTALPPEKMGSQTMGEGSPMSLYPPNKIHASCDLCKSPIARYEGYRHAPIGVKRVVCAECQAKLGLPLREAEAYANFRD